LESDEEKTGQASYHQAEEVLDVRSHETTTRQVFQRSMLAGGSQVRTAFMCLVLCACGGSPGMEEATVQEHISPPKDNGKIENPPSNNSSGCSDGYVVMIEGQLFVVPAPCNEGVALDRGDPIIERGDPSEKILLKAETK
jgi:hypothetical protein